MNSTILNNKDLTFEEIYRANFKLIYKYLFYKNVDKFTVEDLCQEIFLRFNSKYGKKHLKEEEVRKILFGITNNVFKEWVRDKIKYSATVFDEEYHVRMEDIVDVEFEKAQEKRKKTIIDCMKDLNPKIRAILQYRFFKGFTRKETAKKLNMKEVDVHTYQKRGIKYIEKIIKKTLGQKV